MQLFLKSATVCAAALGALLLTASPGHTETPWVECQRGQPWVTCVVDGDSLWFNGVEYRLRDIDAPERDGRCAAERDHARAATAHLIALLSPGLKRVVIHDTDRYGRPLVRLWTDAGQVGQVMVAAGFAVPFGKGRPDWCRP